MKQLIFSLAGLCLLSGALSAQVVGEAPLSPELNRQRISLNIPTPVTAPMAPNYQKKLQENEGPMKAKTFAKSFALDNSDKVNISNVHGSITFKQWDKKEIKVDVDIKAYATTDVEAQKLIDEVGVEANKNGDLVTFKTILNERGNYGNKVKNGKVIWSRVLKINYVVYMPASAAITAAQKYGPITAGTFTGPTSLKVQYGDLNVSNLTNANNYISVQYGNVTLQEVNKAVVKQQYGRVLTIGTIGTLDLNVQYAAANISTIKGNAVIKVQYGSGLTVGSVDNLDLNAQYAKVKFNNIDGAASIKQQYGALTLGTVTGKLNFIGQYCGITISSIKSDANINMEYDKLTINEVGAGCRNLNIKSEYVNIVLGFADNFNANVEVNTDYAGFKYEAYNGIKQIKEANDRGYSSKKYYSGKIGNGGVGNVKIDTEYGGVTFK